MGGDGTGRNRPKKATKKKTANRKNQATKPPTKEKTKRANRSGRPTGGAKMMDFRNHAPRYVRWKDKREGDTKNPAHRCGLVAKGGKHDTR